MDGKLRVSVVGGGIAGLSTARALRRLGHEVILFERGPLPNPEASSYDQHRLIRYPYGASAAYTAMVGEAYRAWDGVWSDLGERHYAQTGTLVVRRDGEAWSGASASTLRQSGIAHSALDPTICDQRYPHLAWANTLGAYYLETGGTLFADRITTSLVHWLRRNGAQLHVHALVKSVDSETGAVTLADGASERADAVVVTAGAWLPELVPEVAAMLTPSRQVVVYIEPPQTSASAWLESPMVLDLDGAIALYIVPPRLGAGLKTGDHAFTGTGDPTAPRGVRLGEAEAIFAKCGQIVRDADQYRIASAKDCFYTVAPDERFYVHQTGKRWIVSACSGHGFKFGPVLGDAVAESISGRRLPADLAAWAAGIP